jgi:hypothetical protein
MSHYLPFVRLLCFRSLKRAYPGHQVRTCCLLSTSHPTQGCALLRRGVAAVYRSTSPSSPVVSRTSRSTSHALVGSSPSPHPSAIAYARALRLGDTQRGRRALGRDPGPWTSSISNRFVGTLGWSLPQAQHLARSAVVLNSTRRSNKGMNLTKPAQAMKLRSLSLVLGRQMERA